MEEANKTKWYKRVIHKQFFHVFVAHTFWVICRNVSRTFEELCMHGTPYWCTVLVHQYGRRKSTKSSGLHFFYKFKALSFHSRTNIRAHKHIFYYLKWLYCLKSRGETFFKETAFLFWCHALWKLGSSNCCIFEVKHATGMETRLKIYFLFIFNLV